MCCRSGKTGRYILLLSENRSEAAYLSAQGGANVLRAVGDKVLDRTHYLVKKNGAFYQCAETRDLTGNGCSHLGLVILEKLDERGDKISRHNLLINSLCD